MMAVVGAAVGEGQIHAQGRSGPAGEGHGIGEAVFQSADGAGFIRADEDFHLFGEGRKFLAGAAGRELETLRKGARRRGDGDALQKEVCHIHCSGIQLVAAAGVGQQQAAAVGFDPQMHA